MLQTRNKNSDCLATGEIQVKVLSLLLPEYKTTTPMLAFWYFCLALEQYSEILSLARIEQEELGI